MKRPLICRRDRAGPGFNSVVADGAAGQRTAPSRLLAKGPDGTLWIVEDNPYSDIWVATPKKTGTVPTSAS